MREKFSMTPSSSTNSTPASQKRTNNSCLLLFVDSFTGSAALQDLPGDSRDAYIFTTQNELFYAFRTMPTSDSRTSDCWQRYLPIPLNNEQVKRFNEELLNANIKTRMIADSASRQYVVLKPAELRSIKDITKHARRDSRSPVEVVKVWHRIPWLPGYLVSGIAGKGRIFQTISDLRLKRERTLGIYKKGTVSFPVTKAGNFTLIRERDAISLMQVSLAINMSHNVFQITSEVLTERRQAKLAHFLIKKAASRNNVAKEIISSSDFKRYLQSESYRENLDSWLMKQSNKTVSSRNTRKNSIIYNSPRPFRYFGNSLNYADDLIKVLTNSDEFAKATVIRDVTCGSCALTFYLAARYPDKKYIASDINGELINLLNHIKSTPWEILENSYRAHYQRCFAVPGTSSAVYKQMVQEYNDQKTKDYSLLLFIQNYAFTNVNFKGNTIKAILLEKKARSIDSSVKSLRQCKELISKGNIDFVQMDMLQAMQQAQPNEMCFVTPPHEHDDSKLYIDTVSVKKLVAGLKMLNARKVPFALTYGDNCAEASSDLTKLIPELFKYTYIIQGGRNRTSKAMIIYFSENVVSKEKIAVLNEEIRFETEKLLRRMEKELRNLDETTRDNIVGIATTRDFYARTIEIARQVLAELSQSKLKEQSASSSSGSTSGSWGTEETVIPMESQGYQLFEHNETEEASQAAPLSLHALLPSFFSPLSRKPILPPIAGEKEENSHKRKQLMDEKKKMQDPTAKRQRADDQSNLYRYFLPHTKSVQEKQPPLNSLDASPDIPDSSAKPTNHS
ncbi:DNA adenine methylase [Legionella cardiaca]|uniref:site-specific DNA-methyltransferase (adenine-specific) n=1 Tax=Legionella cardiaca TaxID=1071983 RepID=A0ABY8AP76_9GAMM|nr:DNA adenine methylase [Legionella cardiaca]WED42328.1 DNA adenine methylase [Legionella cardiaca]